MNIFLFLCKQAIFSILRRESWVSLKSRLITFFLSNKTSQTTLLKLKSMKFPCCPLNYKKFCDSVDLWEFFRDTAFNTRFNGLDNYRRAPYRVRLVCNGKVGIVTVVCYKSGLSVKSGMKYTLLKAAAVNVDWLGRLMCNYHVIKAYLCWGEGKCC